VHREIALEDAGGGAGSWAVAFEPAQLPAGTRVDLPGEVVVPGTLTLDLSAAAVEGELAGVVVLRRNGVNRRIPLWGRVAAPHLVMTGVRTLARTGVYAGDTRGGPSRVDAYRYPDVPAAGIVTNRLAGPEQVFRVVIRRPVANFGVAITWRAPGVHVQPRIVVDGDENRLTGYAALPFNLNPYVDEFEEPSPAAGAILPAAGTYAVVFDSPTRVGAGAFRFRFWTNDATPPTARLATRTVRTGRPLIVRVADTGSGVDPLSLEASLDERSTTAVLRGGQVRISTAGVAAGRHRLRLRLADYQESRNMENVARILPNTRVLNTSVTVRRR
jgi:hypothetical protein